MSICPNFPLFLSLTNLYPKYFEKNSLTILSSIVSLNLLSKFSISLSIFFLLNLFFSFFITSSSFSIFKHSIFSKYSLYFSISSFSTKSLQKRHNFFFKSLSESFFSKNFIFSSISLLFKKFNVNSCEFKKS